MKLKFFIPTFLHLLVDFFSIAGLYLYSQNYNESIVPILIYTCFAFLLQPLVGVLIDRSKNPKLWISVSFFITLLGFASFNIYSHAVIGGIGNALFHVSGGKIILDKSKKSSSLGVFISFGAIGVLLASLNIENLRYIFFVVFALLGVFLAITNLLINYETDYDFEKDYIKTDSKVMIIPLLLICLGVFVRGFYSKYNNYEMSLNDGIIFISLATFLGKAVGGFIKDKFGDIPLLIVSTLLSVLSLFFNENNYMILLGVFGLNLEMALTLDYARKAFPNARAFSFGLLASVLAFSTYFGTFIMTQYEFNLIMGVFLLILNMFTLLISYILMKKKRRIES